MTVESLFESALKDALTTVLEAAAKRVQPEDPGPLGLTIPQAAKLLGVTEACMRELCHRQGFPAVLVSGRYLISRAGLTRWLEAQTGTVGS